MVGERAEMGETDGGTEGMGGGHAHGRDVVGLVGDTGKHNIAYKTT